MSDLMFEICSNPIYAEGARPWQMEHRYEVRGESEWSCVYKEHMGAVLRASPRL
jgi:hypothetical protein